MKKIFITFMVAVSLLTFNRCTSLDMEPVSSISDANYWKSSDQFKAFNTGLHSLLRLRSYNIFVLGEPRADIYGDQPFGGEATQGVERYPYNTINAEFPGISNFGDFYETINQLNLMIRKTNETTLLDENEKNYFLGEAYGMRAYIYFHLLRSWGDVILVTEPTLGNELDISHLEKAASPASEVMDQIKKDIDASVNAFGSDYSYKYGKGYWSKSATLILKGEVYLWSGRQMGGGTGDYSTAKAALQDLQQNGNLKLQDKFTDVFAYGNKENSEIIFAFKSIKDEFTMWKDYNWRNNMVPQREYMANYCDESGTPFMEIPGYNFHGLMRYQVKKDHYWKTFRENDSRLTGTLKAVYQKQEDGSIKYIAPFAYKFQGTTLEGSNERNWLDDYPIYRYADALLLLAEAKALLGEDPSTEINAVRERAYGSEYFNAHKNEVAYPNDKGSFYNDNPFEGGDENVMEAILKERLREFFFEGKRWYDLRRFGNQYVLKYTTAQESRLLWPINEDALTNNPALKQTPGY